MNQNLIYYPCLSLILYSFLMLFWMFVVRVKAIKSGAIDFKHFKTYSTDCTLPNNVMQVSRNFTNLLEVPTIFYVICAFIMITSQVDQIHLILAWTYVILRLIHSWIHITSNKLNHRVLSYALSWMVLMLMAIRLGIQIS